MIRKMQYDTSRIYGLGSSPMCVRLVFHPSMTGRTEALIRWRRRTGQTSIDLGTRPVGHLAAELLKSC